jgi:hypothetical protein
MLSIANCKAQALGYASYSDYLENSFYWHNYKKERLKNICAGCLGYRYKGGLKWLEMHHLTYERLGAELPEDCVTLCTFCHKQASEMVWRGECNVEDTLWILRKLHLVVETQMSFNFEPSQPDKPDSVFTELKKAA